MMIVIIIMNFMELFRRDIITLLLQYLLQYFLMGCSYKNSCKSYNFEPTLQLLCKIFKKGHGHGVYPFIVNE